MKNGVVDLDVMKEIVVNERKYEYFLDKEKMFWAMFYTIPTYHNPTGMTLSPGKRIGWDIRRGNMMNSYGIFPRFFWLFFAIVNTANSVKNTSSNHIQTKHRRSITYSTILIF